MRCRACNVALSDEESVRKDVYGYVDLCNHCFHSVDDSELEKEPDDSLMPTLENYDEQSDVVDAGFNNPTNADGDEYDQYE